MLGSHGLFTWGDTAYESYVNTLEVIERCASYLEDHYGKKGPVFGGQQLQTLERTSGQLTAPEHFQLGDVVVEAPLILGREGRAMPLHDWTDERGSYSIFSRGFGSD